MQHLARDLETFRLTHLLTHDYPQPSHVTHKPGCLLLFLFLPPTSHTLPPQPSWHCETTPLSVSYARQDFIALAVILAVILYIRQHLFLIHSVLGDLLAMPRKTGCPPALVLPTNCHNRRLAPRPSPLYLSSPPTYSRHIPTLAQC